MSRSYSSPLRAGHTADTRRAILEALGAQLDDQGLRDFSIPKVAKRARVSVRTIYRHFPTRDALLDSISDWLNQKMGNAGYPRSAEEIVALPSRLFPGFSAHTETLRAQLSSPAGREMRLRAAHKRQRAIEGALAPLCKGLPAREARRLGAVVHLLFSGYALLHMKDVWRLDVDEAVDASTWAIEGMLATVARTRRQRRTDKGGDHG